MKNEKAAKGAGTAMEFKDIEYYNALIRARITQLREEQNISNRELSLSINKAHSYILDLSKKKILPSMDAFLKICARLGVSPVEFFDESVRSPSESKRVIFEIERLLDVEQVVVLRKVLEQIEVVDIDALVRILAFYRKAAPAVGAAPKRKKEPPEGADG